MRKRASLRTRVCLGLLVGWAMLQPVHAQSIEEAAPTSTVRYAVQLGSFESRAEAVARRAALAADGLKSLWVAEREGRYAVLLGSFDNGAESRAWREELRRAKETSDAFVVEVPADGSPADTALPSVFNTGGQTAASLSLASMKGIAGYEELAALDRPGNDAAYRAALETALASHREATDPMRGYILANLGILDLKQGTARYGEALGRLLPVARGEVAASASVRTMAMTRSAWLLHHTGDRQRALCAWREVGGFTTSESVKARARAEEVGLLLELAESGKATHSEMRLAATRAYAETPADQLKWRAVLELMYSETFARQPGRDAATSARLSEEFVAKYTPLNKDGLLDREIGTAKYQAGLFHERAGDFEKAMEWYEKTLSEVSKDSDVFDGLHPHAEALGGIVRLADRAGNEVLRSEALREILTGYSDSLSAKTVLREYRNEAVEAMKPKGAKNR